MKKWIKILLVIISFAIISLTIYFILDAFSLADINTIKSLILSANEFSLSIYLLILVVLFVFLCFIPLLNTTLIILGLSIFGPIQTFIVCIIANFISSSILFFIGDKFGESFARKLVGQKTLEEAQNLIHNKSKILLPILYIIPAVPDEALSLVAGMTKMKYWYVILVSLIYHALELGLFCFLGSSLIDWSSLSAIDWIVVINLLLIDIYLLLKLENNIKNSKK